MLHMNAWQIGLVVVGVVAVVCFVLAEFRGDMTWKRPRSKVADQAGVERNAQNISTQSWGGP